MKQEEDESPTGQGSGGCACTSPGQTAWVSPPGSLCCSTSHQSPETKPGERHRCLLCTESNQRQENPGVGAKVPRVLWWSLPGRRRLCRAERGLRRGEPVLCRALSPGNCCRASSCGCLGGSTHTCCAALAEARTPIASPPCFKGLESLLRNCSEETLGPARAEGRGVHT